MNKVVRIVAMFTVLNLLMSLCFTANAATDKDINNNSDYNSQVSVSNDYDLYLLNKGSLYDGKPIQTDINGFTTNTADKITVGQYKEIDNAIIIEKAGTANFKFAVPESAYYEISVEYIAVANSEDRIDFAVLLNGEIPYEEADNIVLDRVWVNQHEITANDFGNESVPIQVQKEILQKKRLKEVNGLYLQPLRFYLEKGTNEVSFKLYSGEIAISNIALEPVTTLNTYEEYVKNYSSVEFYDGKDIVIQGQDAILKSSKELRPTSDKSDPAVTPSNAFNTKINCIGGDNWDSPGEVITWEFNAPKTAMYTITFNYRQGYLTNASSIRSIKIDDKIYFDEVSKVAFPYNTGWKLMQLGGNEPFKIYLKEGTHTISLEVSLGDIADISRDLENLIFNVGELYRQIIMITGTSPDINRDYRLYEQIPDLEEKLIKYKNEINVLVDRYNGLTNAKGGSNAVTLEGLARVLEDMSESKFSSHEYVGELFNNYSSSSAWIYEMRLMPLDIEKIIIAGENVNFKEYKSSFFERFIFGFKKLIASFTVDYNSLSSSSQKSSIDVWINLGRDQANVLSKMIEDSFTPEKGIGVNLKIATASIIQAKLSGSAPDCTIMQERSAPVNLAMRGALYDLSKFSDFEQVVQERYGRQEIITPYIYKDGVYGLPDTETYALMYVRDDIFEQLGIEAPKTWDEFIRCSAVIMRNNLSVGLPAMYTTFLYQFGGELYNSDLTATALQTPEAYSAFEFYCDLYCDYKFPREFSFYNRFRTGEMPLGISPHTDFATLVAAAPEINGRWSVYPIPGIETNGEINNVDVGGGTASIILSDTKNPKGAWEFLKWWTDSEAQYRYSSDVESIAGIAARHPTANINAISQYSWGRNSSEVIIEQFKKVVDTPQVPGGYYLTRAVNNAFYSVYSEKQDPKKMLLKWSNMVNEEMTRKIAEYS